MERNEQVAQTQPCPERLLERSAPEELPAAEMVEARTTYNVDPLRVFAELAHAPRRLVVRHEVYMRHLRYRVPDRFVVRTFGGIAPGDVCNRDVVDQASLHRGKYLETVTEH